MPMSVGGLAGKIADDSSSFHSARKIAALLSFPLSVFSGYALAQGIVEYEERDTPTGKTLIIRGNVRDSARADSSPDVQNHGSNQDRYGHGLKLLKEESPDLGLKLLPRRPSEGAAPPQETQPSEETRPHSLEKYVRQFLGANPERKVPEFSFEPSFVTQMQLERAHVRQRMDPHYKSPFSPFELPDSQLMSMSLSKPMHPGNKDYSQPSAGLDRMGVYMMFFDRLKFGDFEVGASRIKSKHDEMSAKIVNESHKEFFMKYNVNETFSVYYATIPKNSQGGRWDMGGVRGKFHALTFWESTPFETTLSGVIEVPISRYTLINKQAVWLPPWPTPSAELNHKYFRVQAGTIPGAGVNYIKGDVHLRIEFDAFFQPVKEPTKRF